VLHDIKSKIPLNKSIILQQDDAKAHLPLGGAFLGKGTKLFGDLNVLKLYP
jgi:hypothetical protein